MPKATKHPLPGAAPWRVGDASSRLLLDVAAGRAIELDRPLRQIELELAVRHGLIGIMADHPNHHLRSPSLPLYARLAARQGVMGTHLRRLLESLQEAGIRATVLKGPHLARWAYANPTHRTYTDIDLLVPHGDIEAALEVIAADPSVIAIPPKTPKADKRNVSMGDESGIRFTLDLHWDLFSYTQLRGCAGEATAWAWEHAEFRAQHALGPLWEMPVEAQLAFLCTHALLDHRFRLVLFRDLAEVASSFSAWDKLVEFGQRWKLQSFIYFGLLIAARATDASVPPGVLASLRRSNAPSLAMERLLPHTDLTTFDEKSAHVLNVSALMLHDQLGGRVHLGARALAAVPQVIKAARKAPQAPSSTPEIVYIGGFNRSGTTLIDLAIGQVPGFVSCGELINLWSRSLKGERLCGCGREILDCPFWQSVGEEAFGSWNRLDLARLEHLASTVSRLRYVPLILMPQLWPPFARRLREFRGILGQLYGAISTIADAEFVIDSSKSPSYALVVRRVPKVNLKVLHVVRDSRGVAFSAARKKLRTDVKTSQTYMPQFNPVWVAGFWNLYNALFRAFPLLGIRTAVMRYEDFAMHPEAETRRVVQDFLEVSNPQLGHMGVNEMTIDENHTVDGNPMRLNAGQVQIQEDSEWRKAMPTRRRLLIEALTWPFLEASGYTLRNKSAHVARSRRRP